MEGDKLDTLIEMVSKQSEFLGSSSEHTLSATQLKKEWFNYVLLSLEKAEATIGKLEDDQHTAGKDLLKGLMHTKEDLRSEMLDLRSAYDASLDKLEKRIEKAIDVLSRKVDTISIPEVKQELKLEITKLKNEIQKEINKDKEELRKDDLDPLKKSVNTLVVKVGGIGIIGGLVGSGSLMAIVAFFKHWMSTSP